MSRATLRRMMSVGTLAGVLATTALSAGAAHAATGGTALAPPDLTGLRQALQQVIAAGAPGVFARVEDSRPGAFADANVSVGTGDLSTGAPVDPRGEFRIGSITKTFTSVMVLKLVADHRVDLDAPAQQYLPAGMLPAGSAITVRELLDHRSGLYDYTNDLLAGDTVTTYEKFRYQVYDPASLVAMSVAHGQDFAPGAAYEYSNTNYVVLGLLLEHVTGDSYENLLNREIIQPLHLHATSFVVPRTGIPGPHAVGYLTQDDPTKPLFDATLQTGSWIWTAGAAISSTADLDTYLRALMQGRLLPPAELAEMEATVPVDSTGTSLYGLGLREYVLPCGVYVYGHDGIVEGYETYAYSTKDGSRQVTISADASNNGNVFATLRKALTPVFCGTAAPATPATPATKS